MTIKIKRTQSETSFLNVESNFATLLDIEPDGTFVYEFEYRALTYQFLRELGNNNCVEILVHKELPAPPRPTIRKANQPGNLQAFTNDILKSPALARDSSRNTAASVLIRTESDLTAGLNKETTTLLKRRDIPVENIANKVRVIDVQPVERFSEDNISPPILQSTTMAQPSQTAQRETHVASVGLMAKGHDPSRLFNTPKQINGTFRAANGVTAVTPSPWTNSSTASVNHIVQKQRAIVDSMVRVTPFQVTTAELNPKTLVPIVAHQPQILLRYEKVVRIARQQVENDDFFVEFRLKNDDGRVREKVIRRVPHRMLVRIFATPRVNPEISISPFQFPGRNIVEVQQLDERAVAVRIFRRTHTRVNIDMMDTQYQQIVELPLRKEDGLVKFVDIVNNFSLTQYRAIAVGPGGFLGAGFNNAISLPVKQSNNEEVEKRMRSAALGIENVAGGVRINVSNVSVGVIAVAPLRRDLTLHETDLTIVDDDRPVKLVTNGLGDITFLDEDTKDEHIYEYSCRLFYDDGVELQSSSVVIHRFKPAKLGEADIEIDGPDVINMGDLVDVQFTIKSSLKESNLDSVKKALEKQGLDHLFGSDLELERDRLQKLIAHSVVRINLTTGETEHFGTFTGDLFSDRREGVKSLVKQLHRGHKYRYVVNTLLRSPETLFDKFEKELKDESTGKAYVFKPAKFRHPITLNKGVLVDRESLVSNHPEDDFSFGRLGNAESFVVDIPLAKIKLKDIGVLRVDKRNVSLRWTVDGPKKNVEHYVIMKETLGMNAIVGKVHHVSSTSTFEFIDRLDPDDIGEAKYFVVPILNDFTRAPESTRASLVVRDGRIG